MVGKRTKVLLCLSKTGERRPTLSDLMWSKITNRRKRSRVFSIAPKLLVTVSDTTSKRSKFIKSWALFCDNSTLDGLYLVGGTRNAHHYKISTFMLFMAMILAGILCYDSLSLYLHYKLRATISYKANNELPFPALTFCNVNMFKRSVTGTDEIFKRGLTFFYGKNRAELPIIMEQVKSWMYCTFYIVFCLLPDWPNEENYVCQWSSFSERLSSVLYACVFPLF